MDFIGNNKPRNKYAKRFRNVCKNMKKRLPIVEWLPKYNVGTLVQDVIAGLTVGLTAIPQGLAYAVVAGLPPEYGLYSSLTAGIIYAIFGTNKCASVGPTAILSTMTAKYVSNYTAEFAVLATFLSGILMLTISVLRLGFIVEFMSIPVVSGFTSAAALQISASQLKSLLGLNGNSGNHFTESIKNLTANIDSIQLWDSVLGISTIVLLALLKNIGEGYGRNDKFPNSFKWVLSLSRNIIVVVVGIILSYVISLYIESTPLTLIGDIEGGLPSFGVPSFSAVDGNTTYTFVEMMEILGPKSVVLPLVAILEISVIGKVFSENGRVDATQEMFALGLCNIIGSFFKSMPITGSFSRSALNSSSGVQTPAASILTCFLVILSLTLLTSVIYFIPKSVLAGLIIAAVMPMINVNIFKKLWCNSKREFCILLTTIIVCLNFGLEYGIVTGMMLEACSLIYKTARPRFEANISMYNGKELYVIKLPDNLLYCGADNLRQVCLDILTDSGHNSILIIDGTNMKYLDFTVTTNLMNIVKDYQKSLRLIYLLNFDVCTQKMALDINSDSFNIFVDSKSHFEVVERSMKEY